MELNIEARNGPKIIVNRYLEKNKSSFNDEILSFQQMVLDQLNIHIQKMNLDTDPT